MSRSSSIRLFRTFVKIFIFLLVILLIMPYIVDQAMRFFTDRITPESNSIIVFKDQFKDGKIISRFIETLRIITNFM